MKMFSFIRAALGTLLTSAALAQALVGSLDQQGNLTWTNQAANATYRVEWASSVLGPWKGFDALTNLLSLKAVTNVVTVQVPMFYRVVWLDAPEPDPVGEWRYWAYDPSGKTLVATGNLTLGWTNFPETNRTIGGSWALNSVPGGRAEAWELVAWPPYSGGQGLWLQSLGEFDNTYSLHGTLAGNRYWGTWEHWGGWGSLGAGTFFANKVPAGQPPVSQ